MFVVVVVVVAVVAAVYVVVVVVEVVAVVTVVVVVVVVAVEVVAVVAAVVVIAIFTLLSKTVFFFLSVECLRKYVKKKILIEKLPGRQYLRYIFTKRAKMYFIEVRF